MYIIVFSIGFGPIPWIMLGEIFPSKIKRIASSIAASFNWLLAFAVTKFFQNLLDFLGAAITFNLFGVICLFGAIFVYVIVPETKGKEHDEIKEILEGSNKDSKKSNNADELYQVTINFKV